MTKSPLVSAGAGVYAYTLAAVHSASTLAKNRSIGGLRFCLSTTAPQFKREKRRGASRQTLRAQAQSITRKY
jgi:hypothetical protein